MIPIVRHRQPNAGSLSRADWLSARNDVLPDRAIIGAGVVIAWRLTTWPDLDVGLGIAVINAATGCPFSRDVREEHEGEEP